MLRQSEIMVAQDHGHCMLPAGSAPCDSPQEDIRQSPAEIPPMQPARELQNFKVKKDNGKAGKSLQLEGDRRVTGTSNPKS
jgi:hypothetical protein